MEDFWIKTSLSFYPYGLNEHKGKSDNYPTIGSLYFILDNKIVGIEKDIITDGLVTAC